VAAEARTNDMPPELAAWEKAVGDAVSQFRTFWISYVTIATYLIISVSTVTHKMLLFESGIKLPVLNVDLPLVGFFVVTPLLFLGVHAFLIMQLSSLILRYEGLERVLRKHIRSEDHRKFVRQRLDSFFVRAMLLSVGGQDGTPLITALGRILAWFSILALPIIFLIFVQIVFLPYHLEWVTWLHRFVLLGDVVLLIFVWMTICGLSGEPRPTIALWFLFGLGTVAASGALLFSWLVVLQPGEKFESSGIISVVDRALHWLPYIDSTASPRIALTRFLFEGDVDYVKGIRTSWFSNTLVMMPDASLVDREKLATLERIDATDRSVSFRGRDLRGAILVRADLRKADFTGADLSEADLSEAKLEQAQFRCADPGNPPSDGKAAKPPSRCPSLAGALLVKATLNGAWLEGVDAQSADFSGAQLIGANLKGAHLEAATLQEAVLFGATLDGVHLQASNLKMTLFGGTSLLEAELQGTDIGWANFAGVNLRGAYVSRVHRQKHGWLPGARIVQLDYSRSGYGPEQFEAWKERMLQRVRNPRTRDKAVRRLNVLDPSKPDPSGTLDADAYEWTRANKELGNGQKFDVAERRQYLVDTACDAKAPPYAARGVLAQTLEEDDYRTDIEGKLRKFLQSDPEKKCPGVIGIRVSDFDARIVWNIPPR
jgi:uncharacterized protein YjbI with pentapeptide repeats